jgi:hypothetical protein
MRVLVEPGGHSILDGARNIDGARLAPGEVPELDGLIAAQSNQCTGQHDPHSFWGPIISQPQKPRGESRTCHLEFELEAMRLGEETPSEPVTAHQDCRGDDREIRKEPEPGSHMPAAEKMVHHE